MRTGGRRTISRSARSTSWTTPSCASRSGPSTSSRGSSATGARPRASTSSTPTPTGSSRSAASTPSGSSGPGHGGPAAVANAYLEGTSGEVDAALTRDEAGMQRLFRQFSFPGGIGSHVTPETPGSIHEGGELGYALVHAFGAAFDNPDLVVFCVVGDGEAETGPLAASWHSNTFLDPTVDGAVIPILALNGYKIANPTILDRIGDERLDSCSVGYGYEPIVVEGDEPMAVHAQMAAAMDQALDEIDADQGGRQGRRRDAAAVADDRPAHPEGLDRTEGRRRQADGRHLARAPGPAVRRPRRTRRTWPSSRRGCAPIDPRSSSTRAGDPSRRSSSSPPVGDARMSANPHANGGVLLRDLTPPRLPRLRCRGADARDRVQRGDAGPRDVAAGRHPGQPQHVPDLRPGRDGVEPAGRGLRGDRPGVDGRDASDRRAPGPGRPRHGGALRAPLPGLARGVPADRPTRAVQLLRGLHPRHRLDVQPARQVAEDDAGDRLAPPDRVAQLPVDEPRLAAGPQRLLPPGPRLHRPRREQAGRGDPGLPAARHQLPALGRGPLPAQPELRQRDRGRQAAGADLPVHGRRGPALHPRHRDLGLGQQRRRRARRRDGLRRRHPDPRDARRRRAPAAAPAGPAGPRGQRGRPDAPRRRDRASARADRARSSTPCSRPTGR